MLRLSITILFGVLLLVITVGRAHAEPLEFTDGFAALAPVINPVMGEPLELPHINLDSGITEQVTTTGLAYYDPDSNTPAFYQSSGERYALTADVGLVKWIGPELLPPLWVIEAYQAPVIAAPIGARAYLYATYPNIAGALDRIISCESNWDPSAKSRISTASGLAQFLSSTWATTPQGQAGYSAFNPIANIDAAAWLYFRSGAWPWLASDRCHRLI